MNRLIKERFIPLKSEPLGDNHKTVLMLTSGQGLIRAAAFGAAGRKARLRPLIQPYSLCEGDLYLDPVKKLWRLKDGACLFEPHSFHESLKKYYAAAFWTELILKTHGGAGSEEFFRLSAEYLETLDRESGKDVPEILGRALWVYLEWEGVRPDLNSCARCGRRAPESRAVCYDPEGHVVCSRCRIGVMPLLTAAGRAFLTEDPALPSLTGEDRNSLFAYLLSILRSHTGFTFDRKGLDLLLRP